MSTRSAPTLAIVLLLLPVLYVGSYLALVVPYPHVDRKTNTWSFEHYRDFPSQAAIVYWPLEQIDRHLRQGEGAWSEGNGSQGFHP